MSLSIGAGIAQGADSFVKSFIQARMMKHQEQYQKNSALINILTRNLEDENLPYSERSRIMDQIPNLLGIKNMERPLSQMMGMDRFNDRMTEDPNRPEVKNEKLNVGGQELQMDIPAGQVKQGNLTPAQIKLKLVKAQDEAKSKNDIETQSKILKVNYTLQKELLGKGGFTKELPATFDADGNYTVRFMNPDGDIITRNLGKVTPEAIRKAQISSGGRSDSSKLGQLRKAEQIVQEYETNNTSHPRADYDAAKEYLDEFERTGVLREVKITTGNQEITGTKKIQPAQTADDTRANRNVEIQLQSVVDSAKTQSDQDSINAKNLADQLHSMWVNEVEPVKQKWDAISNKYDPTDDEHRAIKKDYDIKVAAYNRLKIDADSAGAKDKASKVRLQEAQGRLGKFSSGASKDLTPYKSAIDLVRKNNPDQTKEMSDQQIVDYLRSKGKIK